MSDFFNSLSIGSKIEGVPFAVTRKTIRAFADATLDYNPLHLDDDFMQGNFGKTHFGGVIAHGLTSFGLITRMLTDWAYTHDGMLRRMEARWLVPVKPGDTIKPSGSISATKRTARSRWVVLGVEMQNQRGERLSTGEAHVEFPKVIAI